jgi:hypothetical protein
MNLFDKLYKKIINEQTGKAAVVTYARMNPITIGHKKLVDKVVSDAEEIGATPIIFLSHTQKPKTDPLSLDQKIYFFKKLFPVVKVGNDMFKGQFTPPAALEELSKHGYKDIIFIVGDDRVSSFGFLQKYNGVPDKTGKIAYTFDNLEIRSAGERDPDAEGVEGMSASKMRAAAAEGDYELFAQGIPTEDENLIKELYEAVRSGMGL